MTDQPKHVLVASGLVRNDEGQLLLVKHRLRGWELPQGRVEEGEGLVFALSREILEETGVTVNHERLAVIWCSDAEAKRLVTHPVNRDRMESVLSFNGTLKLHSYATGPYRVLS